jgi:hypothetical protein
MASSSHEPLASLAITAHLQGELRSLVMDKIAMADQIDLASRLWKEDPTIWGAPGTPEIADRLGWLTISERMLEHIAELTNFAESVREEGFTDVVLLGMGGSSLAPEVLRRCFTSPAGWPRLHVLDSTDAATVAAIEQAVDLPRTLFVVSSKSGGTIEPLSMFAYFYQRVGEGSHFVAITDPGSGLEKLAHEHGFKHVFSGDRNIGGRYSALSAFGLVPGALMGIDIKQCSARWHRPGATSSPSWSQSRYRVLACGLSSWSPSPPARTGGASCRSPTSRWVRLRYTGRIACLHICQISTHPNAQWTTLCRS